MVKNLKNSIAILIAVVILCSSVCSANAAGSYFLKDGYYFGVNDGEAYIHSTDGTGWDIVIPETFLDYYVTEIEKFAFWENQSIEELSFYEASQLRRIGDSAFARCPKLRKTHITESVQEMGEGVFEGCTSLSDVRFNAGAFTEVPSQSFYGCEALQNVVFDNEITKIGNLAFAGCTSLKYIDLPDTVNEIAGNAFSGCTDLVIGTNYGAYALEYAKNNNIDYFIKNYRLGDVNCDGKVNIRDVTYIQLYRVNRVGISYTGRLSGDVSGDGEVNIRDATFIQMYIAKIIKDFNKA